MSTSPRDFNEALKWAQGQAANPTADWTGYCQKFVRSCYGIPALFGSAWAQWLGADEEDRHVGGDPDDAPLGSALCYKGSGPYGHIVLAARPFKSGAGACWSNDLVKYGDIDKVHRDAAVTKWNQPYLGYLTAINHYDLRLKETKPPKPKQDKPYKAVAGAIDRLERALETAKRQKDREDAKALRQEIRRLERMYNTLRRH